MADNRGWEPVYLRAIFFPKDINEWPVDDMWTALGTLDGVEERKRGLVRVLTGHNATEHYSIEIDGARLQITLRRHFKEIPEDPIPTLGPVVDATKKFKQTIASVLATPAPVVRVTFAGQLFRYSKDHEDAVKYLDSRLPKVEVDPAASDFLFKINRKRPASVGFKEINRLTTWSIKVAQGIIGYRSNTGETVRQDTTKVAYAASLELDINSVPAPNVTVEGTAVLQHFDELAELGLEIAEKGDTP